MGRVDCPACGRIVRLGAARRTPHTLPRYTGTCRDFLKLLKKHNFFSSYSTRTFGKLGSATTICGSCYNKVRRLISAGTDSSMLSSQAVSAPSTPSSSTYSPSPTPAALQSAVNSTPSSSSNTPTPISPTLPSLATASNMRSFLPRATRGRLAAVRSQHGDAPIEKLRSLATQYRTIATVSSFWRLDKPVTVSLSSLVNILIALPCMNSKCKRNERKHDRCYELADIKSEIVVQCIHCNHVLMFDLNPSVEESPATERPRPSEHSIFRRATQTATVLLNLLGGNSYELYKCAVRGQVSAADMLKETTWYRRQKEVLLAIEEVAAHYFSQVRARCLQRLLRSGESLRVQLNGAWTHRGHKANMHSFLVKDFDQQIVLVIVVLQREHRYTYFEDTGGGKKAATHVVTEGNYVGTSKGMEGEAFERALQQLGDSGLLEHISHYCADDDGSVVAILHEKGLLNDKVVLAHDPGHRQKNLLRSLLEVLGSGKYKGYGYRAGKFWMTCVKRAEKEGRSLEERVARFKELWAYVFTHYITPSCTLDCPCNQRVQEEDSIDYISQEVTLYVNWACRPVS